VTEFGPILVGCLIKGNISKNSGERIYHVPGQNYYAVTRIGWLAGERWFCSETAARGSLAGVPQLGALGRECDGWRVVCCGDGINCSSSPRHRILIL
jgi:hypothetical protein